MPAKRAMVRLAALYEVLKATTIPASSCVISGMFAVCPLEHSAMGAFRAYGPFKALRTLRRRLASGRCRGSVRLCGRLLFRIVALSLLQFLDLLFLHLTKVGIVFGADIVFRICFFLFGGLALKGDGEEGDAQEERDDRGAKECRHKGPHACGHDVEAVLVRAIILQ